MLAAATLAVLFSGTGPIAYIREFSGVAWNISLTKLATAVMVVSALIFVLGIDLVKEALWDTRHRVSKPEYITIASIMVAMTVWDFVIGVLFGIVVSCEHIPRSFPRAKTHASLNINRLFLRRAKLSATQHSCYAHRGEDNVDSAPA
jgi:hypothetical protein